MEATDLERRTVQHCSANLHESWTTDYMGIQDCPWCRVEELIAAQERLADLLRERQRWADGKLFGEYSPTPREIRKALGWPGPQSQTGSRSPR